ncbi:MAG: succinylglutamate desuccinylase/aspartoacylase family protein, partial [Thiohalobacterales bacterium]|nr:succinylglutamate desuccinylase/aspartoacylase family protein [Thiohalobacterales bacterium]
MLNKQIHIGGVDVSAGESVTIDVPMASLYTHAPMSLPVQVVSGKRDGPRLFVSAAVHGDEINGVEIIRRLLRLPLLKKLRGTLLAIPIVNVYGFVSRSRYLPDRRDLNRSFPGSER